MQYNASNLARVQRYELRDLFFALLERARNNDSTFAP